MLTVLRALEVRLQELNILFITDQIRQIPDPYVLRILINQAMIERVFLARKYKDADEMCKSSRQGGVAWTADGLRVNVFGYVFSRPVAAFLELAFTVVEVVKPHNCIRLGVVTQ